MIALERFLRARRRRLAMLMAVASLGIAVTAAHVPADMDHMGKATVVCLAVVDLAIAAAVIAGRPSAPMGPRLRAVDMLASSVVASTPDVVPRVRAGPPTLQVFRL